MGATGFGVHAGQLEMAQASGPIILLVVIKIAYWAVHRRRNGQQPERRDLYYRRWPFLNAYFQSLARGMAEQRLDWDETTQLTDYDAERRAAQADIRPLWM